MRLILVLLCVSSATAHAGKLPFLPPSDAKTEAAHARPKKEGVSSLEDLKMRKRFGLGMSAAGPLSMVGIEADVNITEDFSVSGGIGTGIDYSTFMVKGRYFLLGEWVSPYIGGGF